MFSNGSTAIEGLSGNGNGASPEVGVVAAETTGDQCQTWTGRAMFFIA